jgi:hypothetical protein
MMMNDVQSFRCFVVWLGGLHLFFYEDGEDG